MRIRRRLSHCESTFSCTFCGRCVDTKQVEPELAALARDPDGMLGRERGQRILGTRRADVVRLVDDDQDRPTLLAPPPQLAEHGRGGQRLLLSRRQRSEVDHEAAHIVPCELGQHRASLRARPDAPAVQAEVPRAADQLPAGLASALDLLEPVEGQGLTAVRERHELGVLLPVGDRVETERGRLRRGLELREQKREPVAGPPDGQRAGRLHVAGCLHVVRVRPQLTEPREVGVRVEHDDLQIGLEQQPLEHDAERVRLAGARLATEKRVTGETTRIEGERHAGRQQQLPDLEPGSSRRGLLEVVADLVGRRRPHSGVVERRAVPAQHTALPLRAANHDLRAVCPLAGVGRSELGPLVPAHLEGHDLAESALGALLEHDVRAGLQP